MRRRKDTRRTKWVSLYPYEQVGSGVDARVAEKKFQGAWNNVTGPLPTIKKIFKIIENDEFLKPYAIYRFAPLIGSPNQLQLFL